MRRPPGIAKWLPTMAVPYAIALMALALIAGSTRLASAEPATFVYWSDGTTGKIQRANPDGSGVIDLITGVPGAGDLAVHWPGQTIYWANTSTGKIQRAPLAGGAPVDVVTGIASPTYIALDVAGGKLYWVANSPNKIQRANLDGSGVQNVISTLSAPGGIDIDAAAGKLYYSDADAIYRSNLDGSGQTQINDAPFFVQDIDAVPSASMVYWNEYFPPTGPTNPCGSGYLYRAAFGGAEQGLTSADRPTSIAVDKDGGRIYWTTNPAPCPAFPPPADFNGVPAVRRANLDGSGVTNVSTALASADGVALGIAVPVGGLTELAGRSAARDSNTDWVRAAAISMVAALGVAMLIARMRMRRT